MLKHCVSLDNVTKISLMTTAHAICVNHYVVTRAYTKYPLYPYSDGKYLLKGLAKIIYFSLHLSVCCGKRLYIFTSSHPLDVPDLSWCEPSSHHFQSDQLIYCNVHVFRLQEKAAAIPLGENSHRHRNTMETSHKGPPNISVLSAS